jgi:hypothetical protein
MWLFSLLGCPREALERSFKGPSSLKTNVFKSICLILNVTYLFQAIRGSNNLDFTGYEKIEPSFDFWPIEVSGDPKPIFFTLYV